MKENRNIPESLRRQIAEYRKSLLYSKAFLTTSVVVSAILLSYLALFISDRIWDTPNIARLVILLSGLLFSSWKIIHFLGSTLRNIFDIKFLAINIQKKHRILGDHLLGAIELAQSDKKDENISSELKIAAIEKITRQSAEIDFRSDIDKKRPLLAVALSGILISLIVLLFVVIKPASLNALSRWLKPFSDIQRFTFTKFAFIPEDIYVLEGEKNMIEVKLSEKSIWNPSSLTYYVSKLSSGSVEFKNGTAKIEVTGPSQETIIFISAYDAKVKRKLIPVKRSVISSISAILKYPEYLNKHIEQITISDGILSILKGTKVSFKGEFNRSVTSLNIKSGEKEIPAEFRRQKFKSAEISPEKQKKIKINWQDCYGFSPAVPEEILLKIKNDMPPESECTNLMRFIPLLRTETINLKIHSSDDFGLKLQGILITPKKVKKQLKDNSLDVIKVTKAGSPDIRVLDSTFLFSPELLNIPEKTTVVIHSWALDYKPGREKAFSPPYQIYILSEEQHIKMIQNKLDKLISDMEDSIRREETALEKNKRISRKDDKKLNSNKTTEAIRNQNLSEQAEKREIKHAASKAAKLMNEAMKNKKFPSSTIAQWSKVTDKMKQIAKNEMNKSVKSLNKAMKAQNSSERRKEMNQAVKQQKETIKKMKKMLSSMNKSMEKLMLESFVNRLNKKASEEQEVSGSLKSILPDVLGSKFSELDEAHQEVLNEIKKEHLLLSDEAGYIAEDLEAFFARTSMKKYKKVFDSMSEFNMNRKLKETSSYIASNFTSRSIRSALNLKKHFLEWAEILRKSNNEKQNNKKDQSQKQKVDMEMLVKMMKLIYDEQLLRKKTRHLDKNRPSKKQEYHKLSNHLSANQGDIHLRMSFIQNRIKPDSPVAKMLNRAGDIMNEVVTKLRTPSTDSKVIAAQTEIIEMLSGAFQQTASSASASAKAAAMAMMMQLMPSSGQGSGAGMSPGSSSMGGNTMRKNMNFADKNFSKDGKDSSSEKRNGSAGVGDVPVEYKNAVESYYKKLNSIK